jgi:hypothetical protein
LLQNTTMRMSERSRTSDATARRMMLTAGRTLFEVSEPIAAAAVVFTRSIRKRAPHDIGGD